MTFKDLQKLIHSQQNTEQNKLFDKLRDKPFWIWDIQKHKQEDIKTKGDCCFNHIIGLSTKASVDKIIFNSPSFPSSPLVLLTTLSNGVSKVYYRNNEQGHSFQ